MRIYRSAVLENKENWNNREEFLLAEMPKKEVQTFLDERDWDTNDLVMLTNEEERLRDQGRKPGDIKPMKPIHVQIIPSRDFIASYHGSADGIPAKLVPNLPGALINVVAWYMQHGLTPYIY